jgi:murein DD-endopeptidase MepM/ murein hydrolase activator NlpD
MHKPNFMPVLLAGMILIGQPFSAHAHERTPGKTKPAHRASLEVKSGEVLFISVDVKGPDPAVVGEFDNRSIPFFKINPTGQYGALIGVDLLDGPGQEELQVKAQDPGGTRLVNRYRIKVKKTKFGVQELTLPKEKVDLDEETLKQVEREQQEMVAHLTEVTGERLWRGPFIIPVEGKMAGTFGLRRIINGQPRNPHTGEDIYAPEGTPVAASNDGIVRLTGDFFLSGKSIVIDHGLGLFTMYFHLAQIQVKKGERVSKGQAIGLVGATGRVTGPHLHWGVRLNGARVNPFSLVKLPLDTLDLQE